MTVQQERPTAAPSSVGALPVQRTAPSDEPTRAPQAAPARQPGAWSSEEDRLICRWMLVGLPLLSIYACVFVYLGSRVWG